MSRTEHPDEAGSELARGAQPSRAPGPKRYAVLVDDNFHSTDEGERYNAGTFDTYEHALAKCRAIVDSYLAAAHKPGMTADELYSSYTSFGDDPWVQPTPEATEQFSAWTYARERCASICG